jgi:hypothetical protein
VKSIRCAAITFLIIGAQVLNAGSAGAQDIQSPSGDLTFHAFPNAPYNVPESGLKLNDELRFSTSKYALGDIQIDLVAPGNGIYQEVIFKVDGPGGYFVETPNTFWPITIPWEKLKEGTNDYKATFSFYPKWQENYIQDACVKGIVPGQPVEIQLVGEDAVFWQAECSKAVKRWTGTTFVKITKLSKNAQTPPTVINQTNKFITINNITIVRNKPVKVSEIAKNLNVSRNSKDKYFVKITNKSSKICRVSKNQISAVKNGLCQGELKVTYSNGKQQTKKFQIKVKA